MKLEYGHTYRARNGQLFTLETLPTSYFLKREGLPEFCAKRGRITWEEDGKYGLPDWNRPHPLDLLEELPCGYKPTKLEELEAATAAEMQAVAEKELDEYVVVKLQKWQLMLLTAVIGGTSPHDTFQKVLGSFSNELRNDVHFNALRLKIKEMDAHVVYEALTDTLVRLGEQK